MMAINALFKPSWEIYKGHTAGPMMVKYVQGMTCQYVISNLISAKVKMDSFAYLKIIKHAFKIMGLFVTTQLILNTAILIILHLILA
jgi:hypothetical protein